MGDYKKSNIEDIFNIESEWKSGPDIALPGTPMLPGGGIRESYIEELFQLEPEGTAELPKPNAFILDLNDIRSGSKERMISDPGFNDIFSIGAEWKNAPAASSSSMPICPSGDLGKLYIQKVIHFVPEGTAELPEPNAIIVDLNSTRQEAKGPRRKSPDVWQIGRSQLQTEEAMQQVTDVLSKDERALALRDFADVIVGRIPLLHKGKTLYHRRGTTYYKIDRDVLQLLLQVEFPDDSLYGTFRKSDRAELYEKVRLHPDIQYSEKCMQNSPWVIPLKDKVLDLDTGEIRTVGQDEIYFSCINLDSSDLDTVSGEEFEDMIDTVFHGNRRCRQLLLEIIGVILSGYMPKKFFLFFGPANTGKSQLINLIKMLIGEEHTTSFDHVNRLSDQYALGQLMGKKLCLFPDIPAEPLRAPTVAAIKQITGGDLLRGEQKYQNAQSFRNDAKILMASNSMIKSKKDGAFEDRMIVLPFRYAVPEEDRIPNYVELLYEERGYIVRESMRALNQLRENDMKFTTVNIDSIDTSYEHIDVLDIDGTENEEHVHQFAQTHCIFDEGLVIPTTDLYKEFCSGTGSSLSLTAFSRILTKLYPQLGKTRNACRTGLRGYSGIALKSEQLG